MLGLALSACLDRGQLGPTSVVRFERLGRKLLLVPASLDYRAVTTSREEQCAVRKSFAESANPGVSADQTARATHVVRAEACPPRRTSTGPPDTVTCRRRPARAIGDWHRTRIVVPMMKHDLMFENPILRPTPWVLLGLLLAACGSSSIAPDPDSDTARVVGPACVVTNAGTLPGIVHAAPDPAWITDTAYPFSGGGPHLVRQFDSCFGTDTGDPTVCVDTIDYVDDGGQTRRLPYRVTAPRDLAPSTGPRPVIVFQHGGGANVTGHRAYDNLVTLLGSYGYVVVQTAVIEACPAGGKCLNTPQRDAYCAVYGQVPGADCNGMNLNYFNRPRDLAATIDALPRVLASIDQKAGTRSLSLATLADPELIAVSGHSAGTNGVLSLAGGRFDYVATTAGTDVDQRDLFPTAFVAFGPNAPSSDSGRGWDAAGFSFIPAGLPMLTLTGGRDYAVDVPACDRPTAYFASGAGNKILHYTEAGTHASIPLNDDDNASLDSITSTYWTPDRCEPLTSSERGTDELGPKSPKTTTPVELEIYAASATAVIPFLQATLDDDAAARATLVAAMQDSGDLSTFDFVTTRLERRGAVGGIAKVLSPRGVTVSGTGCGNEIALRILRRGVAASLALTAAGLPAPASAQISGVAEGGTTATLTIDRHGAPAGTYLVRVTGTAADGDVIGSQLHVTFP